MTSTFGSQFIALLSLLALAGCNGPSSSVTGSVTLDGKEIRGGPEMYATVSFCRADGSGAPAIGIIDESGAYELKTGAAGELPPGHYLVGVAIKQITVPTTPNAMPIPKLISPARYASVKDSGLVAEVKPGYNKFDFALTRIGKPELQK